MERAWIYCRAAHPGMDMLEAQKCSLMAYAQNHNFTITGVTTERGSGLGLSRKGLGEVSGAVDAGKVDILLVKNPARLGRNPAEVYHYLDWLKQQHVKLICENGTNAGNRFGNFSPVHGSQ